MKKHFRELTKLLPPGYTIGHPRIEGPGDTERARHRGVRNHPFVLTPEGKPLVDARGMPITVCSTPNRSGARADLRRVQRAIENLGGAG